MAATLIDERPEEDNVKDTLQQQEEVIQDQETPTAEQPPLPDKYQGKSVEDIVRMHQEAEKLLGKQSSEVGELRKVVDTFIQQQTQLTQQQAPQAEDELDFYADPEGSMAKMIERHPKIKEAEQIANEYRKTTALSKLQARHPDMQRIVSDKKFGDWIQGSKIRSQLFMQADQQFDYDAADELLTLWKERQSTVQQTVAVEKQERRQAVKSASTGNARGSGEQSKKIYRRSDIIKLMKTDPDRYQALSDEIMKAYSEGRVR
jgi:hypothetical protein